ncbi:MAG: methyltransferase domain-containing protein [Ekhidna sp.]
MKEEETYWTNRYQENKTGWDIGSPSTPLKEYIDQLENKNLKILIPGAGNAYEAEYLFNQGFKNVYVLDISKVPLQQFKKRVPNFPESNLINDDFFNIDNTFDLILEQTFFCSFEPSKANRSAYGSKIYELLSQKGKLVGLWFKHPLNKEGNRPFGGSKEEYLSYLSPYFNVVTFEDCYNSISPRMGNELFGVFEKHQMTKSKYIY